MFGVTGFEILHKKFGQSSNPLLSGLGIVARDSANATNVRWQYQVHTGYFPTCSVPSTLVPAGIGPRIGGRKDEAKKLLHVCMVAER